MIIYGSRMYGRKNQLSGWGTCEQCGAFAQHTSYNGRKWGHIYFIPLFPIGPKSRVIMECKQCSSGMHFPEKDVPAVYKSIEDTTQKALDALLAGQETFDEDGIPTSALKCLTGSTSLLITLEGKQHLESILSALESKGLTKAVHLMDSEIHCFNGNLDKAIEHAKLAIAQDPEDPVPLVALGGLMENKKDFQGAKLCYERALPLSTDQTPLHFDLLRMHEALQDFPKLVEGYETCFELVPELTKDKKVMKGYKKACKKAVIEPKTY